MVLAKTQQLSSLSNFDQVRSPSNYDIKVAAKRHPIDYNCKVHLKRHKHSSMWVATQSSIHTNHMIFIVPMHINMDRGCINKAEHKSCRIGHWRLKGRIIFPLYRDTTKISVLLFFPNKDWSIQQKSWQRSNFVRYWGCYNDFEHCNTQAHIQNPTKNKIYIYKKHQNQVQKQQLSGETIEIIYSCAFDQNHN